MSRAKHATKNPSDHRSDDQKSRYFFGRGRERPDWRWLAAVALVDNPSGRVDNKLVRRAAKYLQAQADSLDTAAAIDPEIAAAEAIARDSDRSRRLKILTIANVPATQIAKLQAITVKVLDIWQQLFFDVRLRLAESGWLHHYVFLAEERAGRPDLADELRVAYSAGPPYAIRLLAIDGAATPEDLESLRLQMQLKLRRALKLEIRTPSQANAFVAATVRIEALAAKYQYETQSLENRERQAQRIHDEYMLQLQTEHLKAATAAVAAGVDPYSLLAGTSNAAARAGGEPRELFVYPRVAANAGPQNEGRETTVPEEPANQLRNSA